jgi:hypothetical protein
MDFLWGRNDRHQNQWYPFSIGDWGDSGPQHFFFWQNFGQRKNENEILENEVALIISIIRRWGGKSGKSHQIPTFVSVNSQKY